MRSADTEASLAFCLYRVAQKFVTFCML